MKVEIWADVVCPWCAIGERRFERALAGFEHADDVEVVWRSFELDPSAVSGPPRAPGEEPEPDAHLRRLAAKFGTDVEQVRSMVAGVDATAAEEGLVLHQELSVPANTAKAHQVLHLARERGVQVQVQALRRLVLAHFAEGEALGDDETLVRLAAQVGLDAAEVRDVLARDALLDAVRADEAEAAALGARGVPFFVVDRRYGVSGAQPAEHLLEVLRRAWSERVPQPAG
ncbi:DsbA family oxidoreductase [Kineococcus sp. G2]|uniref:DsbA family oxidoreductase n=1 Tax=Kineococcus sp. G2 TaxID=3127484 RepID=UPI00301C28F1